MLIQQLVEDVTGKDFGEVAQAPVLTPLEMADSTYAQPLPEALHGRVSEAHNERMERVPTGGVVLPELAAAGLWSTAHDLARFAVAILRAQSGSPGAILPPALAQDMLRSQREAAAGPEEQDWGLGLALFGTGDERMAKHDGSNPSGYFCTVLFFFATGQGAAVMVSSNRGYFFIREVLRALRSVYGWPGTRYRPVEVPTVALSASALEPMTGDYQRDGQRFTVRRRNDHLRFVGPGPVELDLYPVSDMKRSFSGPTRGITSGGPFASNWLRGCAPPSDIPASTSRPVLPWSGAHPS